MFTIVLNMLSMLSATTETILKKGTKIKIKYNYKKREIKEIKDIDQALYLKESDKYNENGFFICSRTVFVPEFEEDGTANRVKQIKDNLFNMEIDFYRNCFLKFHIRDTMLLQLIKDGNEDYEETITNVNQQIYLFMNKNDFLFKEDSNDKSATATFKIDEKMKIFAYNNREGEELTFSCFCNDFNDNLFLFDIFNFDEVENNKERKLAPNKNDKFWSKYLLISYLNNKNNVVFKPLLVAHINEDGNISLDPLILDATLIDETRYKLISEITDRDEIVKLGLNLKLRTDENDDKTSETEQHSFLIRYKIPIIISLVIVIFVICLISNIIIIRYYKNKKKQSEISLI